MIPRSQYLQNIQRHYRRSWGDFDELHFTKGPPAHVRELPPAFSILRFPASQRRSLFTYATCGMSLIDDAERIECFLLAPFAEDDTLCELLTVTAWYHRTGARLGCGHTVNFGRPWLTRSHCDHGLFSVPYLDGPELEWLDADGTRTQFLWLIPITSQERDFK